MDYSEKWQIVEEIGEGAFNQSNLEFVIIPDSVFEIGKNAFAGLDISQITLGTGFTNYWLMSGDTLTGHIAPPAFLQDSSL